MLLKAFFLLTTVLALVHAEPPPAAGFRRRAPYAAAGWRPDVPFNLPREYLPPASAVPEPQRLPPNIELSKQRIEHVAQLETRIPHSTYATPQLDLPNEQQLPNTEPAEFYEQQQSGQQQTATAHAQQPAAQYGPPANSGFRIIYAEEDGDVEAPASAEQLQQRDIKQGRYYIVSPDKKLQRVTYRTAKNRKDAADDGFTAQLRYSTVGELQDPIYRYNEDGQLVRVLK